MRLSAAACALVARHAACTIPYGMDELPRNGFDESFAELRLDELERRARNGNGLLKLRDWVALAEAWRIAQALRHSRGNRSAAARELGIGRRTLYSKMEKLGLVPSWVVSRRPAGLAETAKPELS
jgi:DNA-binding NtrC family response regulator